MKGEKTLVIRLESEKGKNIGNKAQVWKGKNISNKVRVWKRKKTLVTRLKSEKDEIQDHKM